MVMMTDKSSLPKNWRVTSKDSYKRKTKRKRKWTWEKEEQPRLLREKKWDPPPERERLEAWEKELLYPEIKGITNFYSSSERRKPTNSSHRDLLTT